MLHRLLLLPLLSPLLVTLLVAAINLRPSVRLRLLTWQTSPLPIGLWMALAAGGGAALSGAATALALRQGARLPRRRTVRRSEVWDPQAWEPPRSARAEPDPPPVSPATAGPSRAPGDPTPTVSVPFRVLHRPAPQETVQSRSSPPPPPASVSGPGQAVAHEEGDWGEPESEEW
ncbi:hypothetical protein [Synechococcus sp. CCY 9618]|uniref:hypothetical protein n=1 Tax=Synechococcus sp. CCY 9618 TaxID=2815602 RepID=UPI001C21A524|nr:hypothetical protein [Synechococcus sp. CCY 9618]